MGPAPLTVAANGRFLATADGRPVFLAADTAWTLPGRLRRDEATEYLRRRREQKFNAIAMVAFWSNENVYGAPAFRPGADGRPDPTRPAILARRERQEPPAGEGRVGSAPAKSGPAGYDYWDHLDYILDQAAAHGLYVVLLPTWGTWVAGLWDGDGTSRIIFGRENAQRYGRWIGQRYGHHPHVLWMLGGDRRAVYGPDKDYREVVRAMARGVTEGVRSADPGLGAGRRTICLSYHSRKDGPQSSHWFHADDWLTFNSVQEWPEAQIAAITRDCDLAPTKPTWLFEGRYEQYRPEWGAWQVRFQAYQTVFSGGFGHAYGHERVFAFHPGWRNDLEAPGAIQMGHLFDLATSWRDDQYLDRVADQELIEGDRGAAERLSSSRITATRGAQGDYAMLYSANGRTITVRMERLAAGLFDAFWYDPRTGGWRVEASSYDLPTAFAEGIRGGGDAPLRVFDPPGRVEAGNDWVLVVRAAGRSDGA